MRAVQTALTVHFWELFFTLLTVTTVIVLLATAAALAFYNLVHHRPRRT
ncbi:hypothetical protein ACWFRJ_33845 [Streptomyces sp. NPDC055239]